MQIKGAVNFEQKVLYVYSDSGKWAFKLQSG
jgi:hypothetical protein